MSKTSLSTARYLRLYQAGEKESIELLSTEFDRGSAHGPGDPVAMTWQISFAHIEKRVPRAAEYLKLMCFFAEKDIPESLLPAAENELMVAQDALGALKGYAFITERDESKTFDVHRLVRLSMRNWLSTQGERRDWTTKAIRRLEEVFPDTSDHTTKQSRIDYLPHAQAAVECLADCANRQTAASLLQKMGWAFFHLGSYEQAQQIYRRELELNDQLEAEPLSRKFLGLHEKVLPNGREHALIHLSMNNLAAVLTKQSREPEAEDLVRHAVKLKIEVDGLGHRDVPLRWP